MKTLRLVFLLAMPILLWTNSIATPTNYGYRHIMGSAQQNEQGAKKGLQTDSAKIEQLLSSLIPLRSELKRRLNNKGSTHFYRNSLRCTHVRP